MTIEEIEASLKELGVTINELRAEIKQVGDPSALESLRKELKGLITEKAKLEQVAAANAENADMSDFGVWLHGK